MDIPRGAAALLLALLAGCRGAGAPGDARHLLANLPADVDVVAFVDVQGVYKHPLWSKVQEDPFIRSGQAALEQFQGLTGLDPGRDLQMLLFAARSLGRPEMDLALVARGTLDRRRIEDLLLQTGFVERGEGGVDLFAPPEGLGMPAGLPGVPRPHLAFLDDFTLALGSDAFLTEAVRAAEGEIQRVLDSEDLGPLIEEGLGSGQFWGVFRSRYLADQLRARIEEGIPLLGVLRGFSGINGIRFSMRFSDSIDLVARARTGTEEDARLLADTLNGFLALAKLAAKDQPDLLRFLEGALVGLDVDAVRLSMNLDGATIEKIRGGWLRSLQG